MKKATVFVLAAALLFSMAACGKTDNFKNFSDAARLNAERATELNNLVEEEYFVPVAKMAYHYYPNENGENGDLSTAFAWPYTEIAAANYRIATLSEGCLNDVKDYYVSTLDGFEYYKAGRNDYTCYSASRSPIAGSAGGDTYYDDNIWIAREFLNAYELLGDEKYLLVSKGVCEYVWSGWANDELGGIYWKEQQKTSRNTCSNAPAVILFCRMYEQSNDSKYLERALKIYDFCYSNLRDPSDNVYWDNVNNFGSVDRAKYTYNTGSMIAAAIKLYEIKQEQKYLDHAKASAAGAYAYWFRESDRGYRTITSSTPWFNVLLLDGFTELYRYDKSAMTYIADYEANLDYAYENFRCEAGFMSANWSDGFTKDGDGNLIVNKLNVLDMAANAENFAHLAYFYKNVYVSE